MTEMAAEAPRGRAAARAQRTAERRQNNKFLQTWFAILVFFGIRESETNQRSVWTMVRDWWRNLRHRDEYIGEPDYETLPSGARSRTSSIGRVPAGTVVDDDALDRVRQSLEDDDDDAAEEEDRRYRRSVRWIVGGVILAAVVVATWLIIGSLWGDQYRQEPTETVSQSQSPAGVPTTAPLEEEFVIDMPRRDGHRLNADGVKVKDDAEAFRAQIADQAMHDPMTLFLYYNASPLGKVDPITSETDLAKDGIIKDGNVFSEEGRKRYEEWAVLWKVADINSVREITFQGVNTGVDGNRTTQSNGVTGGNKAGYDISYKDAQGNTAGEHSALERCTQPTAGKRIPGPKEGPTDNPKPPEEKLNPKSGDKRDYKRPGDGDERDSGEGEKPPARVTTGPESTPATVVTEKPGGGGVVDKPTNNPGSESGATAPGASNPGEERDNPPPNEGGSNNGTVGGF